MRRHALFALFACALLLAARVSPAQDLTDRFAPPASIPPPPAPGDPPGGAWSNPTPAPMQGSPPVYRPSPLSGLMGDDPEYPTLPRLTGFFHLDTVWFGQDATNRAAVGDVQDGIDFRRARLAGVGKVTKNVEYHMEFDFADSQALFVDDFVGFTNVPILGNVRIGRWRQPFGMSALTGIRELPFLERALPFAFVPFRQTGIGAFDTALDGQMTWAISVYRYPTFGFGNNFGDNGGYGMTGRITALPVYEDDGERLLHIGFDYSFDDPSNDQLRFQSTPEIFDSENEGAPVLPGTSPITTPWVDTGVVPTQNLNLIGVEGAAAYGPVYLQSEVYWAVVKLTNGNSNTLPGAYVQARWILTGERLPYVKSNGVFGRVVPNRNVDSAGGIGAWELTARWSYIDLNGPGFPGPGRRLNDLTFGLNWYVNRYTKFQFNYIHAFLDDPLLGDSDADVAALRAQVDF